MKQKIKKIVSRVINVLSIIVIIFAVWVLLTVITTKKDETPNILGFSVFRVMSGSMEPEISVNSMIIVKKTEPAQLQVGDVISFYSHDPALYGMVNTHRITEIQSEDGKYVFATKGDANYIADKYTVPGEDVVGKMVFSSHVLGVIVSLLSNPLIFLPLIVLPMAVIIISNLVKTVSLTKQLAQEEEEAAVRDAIEQIKQRKKQEGEAENGGSTED